MLAIFLFSISLGCSGPQTTPKNVTPVKEANVTPVKEANVTPVKEANVTSAKEANVTISSPADGSNVNVSETITGKSTGVYGSGLHLYLLINPVATGNVWWVQPEAQVSSDGTWNVNAQFGRSAQEDIGAKFWVIAIVTPDTLPLGETNYPSTISASSNKIQLTRK
jgi:hypothetical protein